MKRFAMGMGLAVLTAGVLVSGCGNMDEAKVRELARDEAQKVAGMQSEPEKFGFGVGWEKEFSYSQGTRVGNMLFIAGQLAHGRTVDANGMPEFLMGNFEQQFRATLENIKAVVEHFGGTMDDVVFLQNFVAPISGDKTMKAGDYNPVAAPLIREYFPNGIQAMTFVEVVRLYGGAQLVESNAIAVLKPKAEAAAPAEGAPAQQ
ncbi:MAG: RidA family protein [Candidatus Latescibacterota bacterium]